MQYWFSAFYSLLSLRHLPLRINLLKISVADADIKKKRKKKLIHKRAKKSLNFPLSEINFYSFIFFENGFLETLGRWFFFFYPIRCMFYQTDCNLWLCSNPNSDNIWNFFVCMDWNYSVISSKIFGTVSTVLKGPFFLSLYGITLNSQTLAYNIWWRN